MGKDWDKVVPSVEIWGECFRVMKAGSFAFIMSAPRQDVLSHMIVNLDKAGFDTGFTSIYWTYASGFPKATNMGKMADKRMGAEREVVGTKITGGIKRPPKATKSSDEYSEDRTNNYQSGQNEVGVTIPASDEAKSLDGSYAGFQPKPAVEIIIVAMKPLSEKSYTDQALKNKKGVTWLHDCRIGTEGAKFNGRNVDSEIYGKYGTEKQKEVYDYGRFPANLLVSDDVLND